MSGITAVSATKTLSSGDTTEDHSVSGFVTKEQISLGLTGSPLIALWSLSKPTTSGSSCQLTSESSLTTKFTPDTEGIYTLSCLVDGTTQYVLRISALRVSTISTISAIHLLPCANSQIPTPQSGVILFYSSDSEKVSIKLSDGTTEDITTS